VKDASFLAWAVLSAVCLVFSLGPGSVIVTDWALGKVRICSCPWEFVRYSMEVGGQGGVRTR
jgi:hypothetical protein